MTTNIRTAPTLHSAMKLYRKYDEKEMIASDAVVVSAEVDLPPLPDVLPDNFITNFSIRGSNYDWVRYLTEYVRARRQFDAQINRSHHGSVDEHGLDKDRWEITVALPGNKTGIDFSVSAVLRNKTKANTIALLKEMISAFPEMVAEGEYRYKLHNHAWFTFRMIEGGNSLTPDERSWLKTTSSAINDVFKLTDTFEQTEDEIAKRIADLIYPTAAKNKHVVNRRLHSIRAVMTALNTLREIE